MFMCVVNLESVNKLDLTWKQSFLIVSLNLFIVCDKYFFFVTDLRRKDKLDCLYLAKFIKLVFFVTHGVRKDKLVCLALENFLN